MKKIILFSIVALFLAVFAAPRAEAQSYATRVLSVCPVCHQNVYAYYRPINYGGIVQYSWVPAYHTQCSARASSSIRYSTQYYRPTPYNYYAPTPSAHHHHHSHSPSYSGYLRPGFSITIRR